MNTTTAPAPLGEILAVLESITTALRSDDPDKGRRLLERAVDLLHSRALDSCDRMTLRIVVDRIHRAGGRSLAQTVESCIAAG